MQDSRKTRNLVVVLDGHELFFNSGNALNGSHNKNRPLMSLERVASWLFSQLNSSADVVVIRWISSIARKFCQILSTEALEKQVTTSFELCYSSSCLDYRVGLPETTHPNSVFYSKEWLEMNNFPSLIESINMAAPMK